VHSHHEAREDYYRYSVGTIGAEAMLRLFSEEEANERAFTALTRFLDLLDEAPHAADRPALDPLGLAFQLKLLWLAGYLPHLSGCAECSEEREPLVGYSQRAGGAVCARCAPSADALAIAPDGIAGIEERSSRSRSRGGELGSRARSGRPARRHRLVRVPRRLHGCGR
jgi:DNA repair protein RecO